jgi:hypothetical protein
MVKKGFTPEQIFRKLREADVMIGKGETVAQAIRKLGTSDVLTTGGLAVALRLSPHIQHISRPTDCAS